MRDFPTLSYTSTNEIDRYPFIYLKPKKGTMYPFRVDPLRLGHCKEYPHPPARMLSAEVDTSFRDQRNSSHHTKAECNNCLNISKFWTTLPPRRLSFLIFGTIFQTERQKLSVMSNQLWEYPWVKIKCQLKHTCYSTVLTDISWGREIQSWEANFKDNALL